MACYQPLPRHIVKQFGLPLWAVSQSGLLLQHTRICSLARWCKDSPSRMTAAFHFSSFTCLNWRVRWRAFVSRINISCRCLRRSPSNSTGTCLFWRWAADGHMLVLEVSRRRAHACFGDEPQTGTCLFWRWAADAWLLNPNLPGPFVQSCCARVTLN